MIRFISILISVFIVGYLIVHDTWMVTITAFGFEITTSVLVVVLAFLLVLYLFHLLKKPFQWLDRYKNWSLQRRQSKKEAYLLQVLQTVLDKNNAAAKRLLKQKGDFFDKKSDAIYLLEALFAPTPHIFEQLLHREGTELAGVRGLLTYAQAEGDFEAVGRLLQKAVEKNPNEPWVWEALWEAQVLQHDWTEALKTLDVLKKKGLVDKALYNARRANVLLKLGRAAEAYKLMPDHPATALAYAAAEPKQAQTVIMDLWRKTPCREAFVLFKKAIAAEKPAKQTKLLEKLLQSNPEHRLTILARALIAMDAEAWGTAKEHLTAYINTYSLTATVAHLMAEVERRGWHHEDVAQSWDIKAAQTPDDGGWGCAACGHPTAEWDAVCPHCNAFGRIEYK